MRNKAKSIEKRGMECVQQSWRIKLSPCKRKEEIGGEVVSGKDWKAESGKREFVN